MLYTPDHKKIQDSGLTFSIVIETENLGMAGLDDLRATIACLKNQTYSIERANEIIAVIGATVSDETIALIRQEYPWLKIHTERRPLEYVESKVSGARQATGDIIVFVDSDAVYEPEWLEQMLYGFVAAPGAAVISSETRIRIHSVYTAAIQLIWMINAIKIAPHPTPTTQFHLNNFAARKKAVLGSHFFRGLPIYRANNVEWKKQMQFHGYSVMRVPGNLSHHAPPANFWDFWWRFMVMGSDAVAKTDFRFHYDATVTESFSPLQRLIRIPVFFAFKLYVMVKRTHALVTENWKNIGYIIAGWPVAILFLLVSTIGMVITLFNRDYVFKKITARESHHVV